MAIIRFAFDKAADGFQPHHNIREKEDWPEGAYCPLGSDNFAGKIASHGALVLWEEYKGLCLNDYERNGYDDSDFFMEVWNPDAECVETICFATTRGWTYPSMGSRPDATDEVRAAATRWREDQRRKARAARRSQAAKELMQKRALFRDLAERHGFKACRLSKLIRNEQPERGIAALQLLKSNLRSAFRIKMRDQLVAWLGSESPAYRSPFSARQWACI